MIYVSKEQLREVEYLIQQSIKGNHVLFGADELRRVFGENRRQSGGAGATSEEAAYAVEHHIERMIALPSLAQKRAYLEKLDPETYDQVVRTYFNIVENNLFENEEVRH